MPTLDVSVKAVAQILVLYVVIYSILKASRGSRVGQVLMGVGIIAAAMMRGLIYFMGNPFNCEK